MNGALILAAGIYQLMNRPAQITVQLYDLHAGVWWGGILFVIGLMYCLYFRPRGSRA